MDMSTVKNVAIVALVLGTAYIAYANRKRLLRLLASGKDKRPKRRVKNTNDAMKEVCQAFLMYADNFQGLFETMYKASVGSISHERMRNVLQEWDIRMGNIAQPPICLRSWWATVIAGSESLTDKEMQDRAQSVIQMVMSCGIVRDDRTEIVAAEDTGMYYQHVDGGKRNVGQKLSVESPSWYLPSSPIRIIEKGYCKTL
jgi:hypothetical protein